MSKCFAILRDFIVLILKGVEHCASPSEAKSSLTLSEKAFSESMSARLLDAYSESLAPAKLLALYQLYACLL